MTSASKVGGIAALVQAACYIIGFAMLATVMNPGDTEGWSAQDRLAFLLDREGLAQAWNLIIYVVFGIALVALTSVLHQRLNSSGSSTWMSIATPFGYIWAGLVIASGMVISVGITAVSGQFADDPDQAVALWKTIGVIQNGLGGGVEIVGGVWVLLLSLVAMSSSSVFPKALNWLGVIVGVSGIVTIVPALTDFGAVFGLAQIVWFLWIGVILLRD